MLTLMLQIAPNLLNFFLHFAVFGGEHVYAHISQFSVTIIRISRTYYFRYCFWWPFKKPVCANFVSWVDLDCPSRTVIKGICTYNVNQDLVLNFVWEFSSSAYICLGLNVLKVDINEKIRWCRFWIHLLLEKKLFNWEMLLQISK